MNVKFSIVEKKNIIVGTIILFILFIFLVPVMPVRTSETITESIPVEITQSKEIQRLFNETKWVKVYHTDAVDPPVEIEELPLLYHIKGDCTNRVPDFRSSSTTMIVYNLDSVPGNFTFFIGMEVKRNSDVEGTYVDYERGRTPEKTIIISPCYYDCEEEVTPTPTEPKPTNIVLGEEQSRYIEPGSYVEFSYAYDVDIKQCIFREVTIPAKTIYREIGVRNQTGEIEYWYEPVNETRYMNDTVLVNETVYQKIKTTEYRTSRWTVWAYFTRPRTVGPSFNYMLPPGE